MWKAARRLVGLAAVGLLALAAGFGLFVGKARTLVRSDEPRVDGIVVLTGGEDRITAGLALLQQGRARRMLVSGVNRRVTTPSELRRTHAGSEELQKCCVDIGREAVDTVSNAEEAREWAEAHGFHSLLLVTSSYHMPRSLTEFERAMPWVHLVPYAVSSRHYQLHRWWLHAPTLRLLATEYLKFLASKARLALSRMATAVEARPPRERRPVAAQSAVR